MTEQAGAYGECQNLNKPDSPQCQVCTDPRYQPPTTDQIRDALKHGEHWTGSIAAGHLGVDSRTIRKWTGGERDIPYAAWRLLLIIKGIVKAS